jgi:ketosteroid isomerase-like protein
MGVSTLMSSVGDMTEDIDPHEVARTFFDSYAVALLDRDAAAIADHYAVPALIEFPGASVPVTSREQTAAFFQRAFGQYADVTSAEASITIAATGPHSIWADVAWDHGGAAPDERNMYQLVLRDGEWRIAVLTPLAD